MSDGRVRLLGARQHSLLSGSAAERGRAAASWDVWWQAGMCGGRLGCVAAGLVLNSKREQCAVSKSQWSAGCSLRAAHGEGL